MTDVSNIFCCWEPSDTKVSCLKMRHKLIPIKTDLQHCAAQDTPITEPPRYMLGQRPEAPTAQTLGHRLWGKSDRIHHSIMRVIFLSITMQRMPSKGCRDVKVGQRIAVTCVEEAASDC